MEEPPDGEDWLHEQKFDGYRIGAALDEGRVRLWSRRGQEWTADLPSVATAVAALPARSALFDGEVAVLLPSGVTSFQALQQRTAQTPLVYFVFDLLHLDGEDLVALPLEERKRRLRALLGGHEDGVRYSEHVVGGGAAFHHEACRLGLEGIVSKRRDARHRAGRNLDWRKIKCGLRQELVVGGFTKPEGARAGVGALLVGYYEGARLRFAGKVGTGAGWTAPYLADLRRKLDRLRTDESPFDLDPGVDDPSLRRRALWVRPALVAEVRFAEWTNDGRVRHASIQGLRADKRPKDVRRERPAVAAPSPPDERPRASRRARQRPPR
jgi:bifunctional non-homologous end joining protein LigD